MHRRNGPERDREERSIKEAVMVGRIKETSPRFRARIAGVFYLMDFAFAPAMFAWTINSRRFAFYGLRRRIDGAKMVAVRVDMKPAEAIP